jgi:hypothetical protein
MPVSGLPLRVNSNGDKMYVRRCENNILVCFTNACFFRNMSITSVSSADLSDDPDEEVVQLDNEPRSNTGSTAIRRRSGMFFFASSLININLNF